ncbi:MAG: MFS transporter [Anaerolineae bacterium]|nr:MFS transporter [Anaerolineae bacterium]
MSHKINIYAILTSSFLSGFRMNLINAIWQPFILHLGASMSTLGFIESLSGHRGIIPALAQPVGGWLSDVRGRKPILILGGVLAILYLGLCLLALHFKDERIIFLAIIFLGLSNLSKPALASLVADSVKEKELGTAYSLVMSAFLIPGIFAPAFGGFAADRLGFGKVFILGLLLEFLALFPIINWVRETIAINASATNFSWREMTIKLFHPPARLRPFYIAVAADSFSWGLSYGIIYGMLAKTYNLSTSHIGLIVSVSYTSWLLFQIPAGRLVDRFGGFKFLVVSELVGIPLMVGWLTLKSLKAFLFLQVLWGLVAATWVPAVQSYLALRVPSEGRGEAMGLLNAFRGIFSFPSPFLGGLLYDIAGFSGPILANLGGIIVTLAIFLLLVRE